jgi:hypothetical protein
MRNTVPFASNSLDDSGQLLSRNQLLIFFFTKKTRVWQSEWKEGELFPKPYKGSLQIYLNNMFIWSRGV